MKRLLLPILAAFALPTFAGIPESKNIGKWMKVDQNWMIDTEDVDIKKSKLRFYVSRKGTKDEFEGPTDFEKEFTAKLRINCSTFTSKMQKSMGSSYGNLLGPFNAIKPETLDFSLANYFCFLTGEEGYTREKDEPNWVKKINEKYTKNK